MKFIKDEIEKDICFPVFEKGDKIGIVIEAEVLEAGNWDWFHNGDGLGVCYKVKIGDKIIDNLYGFCIYELRMRKADRNFGI